MSIWPTAYTEHAPGLRAFLHRRLRSREEAEDLCQETFARAIQAEHSIRNRTSLKAFLYQIAQNLVLNQRRRPRLVHGENELGGDFEIAGVAAPAHRAPDAEVEAELLRQRIARALASLPADQRVAFEEGVIGGSPYAEVARRNGWTVAKVKIDVYRARKALSAELDRELGSPAGSEERR